MGHLSISVYHAHHVPNHPLSSVGKLSHSHAHQQEHDDDQEQNTKRNDPNLQRF